MGMGLLDYARFLCDYARKCFTLYDLFFLLHFTETQKPSWFAIHYMYVVPALLHIDIEQNDDQTMSSP
ncbi:hypothetical protein FQ707_12330 [Bacteroidaceae bacterium HV4-6-C5C]|jgi:hypothetical protein|nr:hypothetical protein FQ707_12330 [Bacteroidaceae bacterium HV4-6-C5C]